MFEISCSSMLLLKIKHNLFSGPVDKPMCNQNLYVSMMANVSSLVGKAECWVQVDIFFRTGEGDRGLGEEMVEILQPHVRSVPWIV